jgi:hypothetical protein
MAAKKTSAPKRKAAAKAAPAKSAAEKPAAEMPATAKPAPAKAATVKPAVKAAAKKTPAKSAPKKAAVKAVEPVAESRPAAEIMVQRFSPELLALDTLVTASSKSVVTVVPSSFEDAKEQAIDRLIDLIEAAELRLHQLKRAASYEQFVATVNDHQSET